MAVRNTKKKVMAVRTDKKTSSSSIEKEISSLKNISKFNVILILAIIIIIGLLYSFRSVLVAATVNGTPISRISEIKEAEKQSGKQALNVLITKALVSQEAEKRKIVVSQDEIDSEVKKIQSNLEKQGQNLDQLLAAQGMTRNDLTDQIKLQKMVEKMVGQDVKVTDKEINDYIEQNKASIPENMKPDEVKVNVKKQLTQQKLNEKIQTFIESLQKKAKIDYLVKF